MIRKSNTPWVDLPPALLKEIGDRVQTARRELGLSARKLSLDLGWSDNAVGKIERGDKYTWHIGRFYQLSAVLGKPIGYFLPDLSPSETRSVKGVSPKYADLAKDIGYKVRVLRVEYNNDVPTLCARVKIPIPDLLAIEAGEMLPSIPTLVRLGEYFEVPPGHFLDSKD